MQKNIGLYDEHKICRTGWLHNRKYGLFQFLCYISAFKYFEGDATFMHSWHDVYKSRYKGPAIFCCLLIWIIQFRNRRTYNNYVWYLVSLIHNTVQQQYFKMYFINYNHHFKLISDRKWSHSSNISCYINYGFIMD